MYAKQFEKHAAVQQSHWIYPEFIANVKDVKMHTQTESNMMSRTFDICKTVFNIIQRNFDDTLRLFITRSTTVVRLGTYNYLFSVVYLKMSLENVSEYSIQLE